MDVESYCSSSCEALEIRDARLVRIILSHLSQFDKGEGHDIARVLRRAGHQVLEVNLASSDGLRPMRGYPPEATIEDLAAEADGSDLFLYVDPLALVPRGLDSSPVPTAAIISDVHRNLRSRVELANFFDHVFCYQRNYLRHFNAHPMGTVHWWPWACDLQLFKAGDGPRDLDVAFVGQPHVGSLRDHVLEALAEKYSVNDQRWYRKDEIPGVYASAKIVINMPLADDLNLRFFEAMSCGAMLLTRKADNGADDLFVDGKHFVSYRDEQDLHRKVAYYLEHEDDRVKIAEAGHAEIQRSHSLDERLRSLIERVSGSSGGHAPVRRSGTHRVTDAYARLYERTGRVESILSLAAKERGFGKFKLVMLAGRSALRRLLKSW